MLYKNIEHDQNREEPKYESMQGRQLNDLLLMKKRLTLQYINELITDIQELLHRVPTEIKKTQFHDFP